MPIGITMYSQYCPIAIRSCRTTRIKVKILIIEMYLNLLFGNYNVLIIICDQKKLCPPAIASAQIIKVLIIYNIQWNLSYRIPLNSGFTSENQTKCQRPRVPVFSGFTVVLRQNVQFFNYSCILIIIYFYHLWLKMLWIYAF